MKISKYLLVCFLPLVFTANWNIILSTNPQEKKLNYVKGEANQGECENGKILISRNIEQITLCTNSVTEFDDYFQQPLAFKPLDGNYEKCYRYFSTNTKQAKYIQKKGLQFIVIELKQKGLVVQDFQSFDYTVQICSDPNSQSLVRFSVNNPPFNHQTLKQSFSNDNIVEKNQLVGTVSRKLQGKGFHQQLIYTIVPPQGIDINEEECSIRLQDILPSTTYIDVDQLKSKGKVRNNEIINIEKPEYQAKEYMFQLEVKFENIKQIHPNTYSFRHPLHFRYPTPNNISEFVEVNIHPIQSMKIQCRREEYVLEEDRDMYRGVGKIPVGDSEKLSTVSLVTFISEIMCSLLLVKELRSS